jgi:hypothetical protein
MFGFDVGIETGEIFDQVESCFNTQRRNYLRRAVAQEIMAGYQPVKQLLGCGATLGRVQVWKGVESRTAHLVNVQTCGNVWLCGVCAPKIAVRRGQEVAQALLNSCVLAIGCALVTLTVRHAESQSFNDVFQRLSMIFQKFSAGKAATHLRQRHGVLGSIRVIEITRGLNGWHPHIHQLIFFQGMQDLHSLKNDLLQRWCQASLRATGDILGDHAVDVADGSRAALYVSKMGLEAELTGAVRKIGRGSRTQFQLLDGHDANLHSAFQEFAKAVCRPGVQRASTVRQMVWSRGLAAKLGLHEEKTDEELAAEAVQPARMLGELTRDQWMVLQTAGREAVPNILRLAATSGWPAVELFISLLSGSQLSPRGADEPSSNAAQRNSHV